MIEEIWSKVRSVIKQLILPDVEIFCNICCDGKVEDIRIGQKRKVYGEINPKSIAWFHSHVRGINANQFSKDDVTIIVNKGDDYVYLGVEDDVYGVDISKVPIMKYVEGKIDLQELTDIINDARIDLDWE